MEREGEQISEDHAGIDVFEGFSTLEFLWVPRPRSRLTSMQCPAGRPLRTLQKEHFVLGFSPNVGIRRTSHPVVFAIFPGCHTPANGHRFVDWRGEIMKGKGLL